MIIPVAALDHPDLAEYRHVADHAWLRQHGLFVAEGRLVVRRLLESRRFGVKSVLLTAPALGVLESLIDPQTPAYVAGQEVLNAVTGIDFHRGCLAIGARPSEDPAAARVDRARLLLAIEGVGNPDNVGGLFRVAAAFGAGGVLLDPATGDPFYRKAIRTSMGSVLNVAFGRIQPWPGALQRFRVMGFRILALTPAAGAVTLDELAPSKHDRLIVMVGAEGPGLSEDALGAADAKVRIPVSDTVDSLNVTVAAGIVLSRLFN